MEKTIVRYVDTWWIYGGYITKIPLKYGRDFHTKSCIIEQLLKCIQFVSE